MYATDISGNQLSIAGPHRLVALGNVRTQFCVLNQDADHILQPFYAMQTVAAPSPAFFDLDLAPTYGANCNNVRFVRPLSLPQPHPVALWDQDCQGATGKNTSLLHLVDQTGTRLQCYIFDLNVGTGFDIICGPSQAAVLTCAGTINNGGRATVDFSDLRFQAV